MKETTMDVPRQGGVVTSVCVGSKLRRQTTFPDGTLKVEEYDSSSGKLLVRKWQFLRRFGGGPDWEFDVGEPAIDGRALLVPSSDNPTFHSRDHETTWEWRVRNVPYEKSVFSLSIDDKAQCITLRTSNRKYYKRWCIPSMRRAGLLLSAKDLEWQHDNGTLVIMYAKPPMVIEEEAKIRMELGKANIQNGGSGEGPGGECRQS